MSETTNPIETADNIVNNPIGEISEKNWNLVPVKTPEKGSEVA